ncbi:MAG: hypothetical protein ACRC0R_08060 [Cetobacterium sp.]
MRKKYYVSIMIFFVTAFNLFSADDYKLETIATRPNATLDLTVKKLSSKPITVIIDRIGKTALFEITENDHIYITENLDELSYVSVSGKDNNYNKIVNYNGDLLTGKEIRNGNLAYQLYSFNGKKVIDLKYEIEPTDLYVGIVTKDGDLEKVYKAEFVEDVDKKFETLGLTIETPETMDFTKAIFSGTRTNVVASRTQIVVNNPSNSELELRVRETQINLTNGTAELPIKSFEIENSGNQHNGSTDINAKGKTTFILTGLMDKVELDAAAVGKYKGTVTLDLYVK